MTAIFAATLLFSGALLFSVQPLVGKLLLPLVGGAPAVWNVCMLFFQGALLGGYLYAHLLTRRLRVRTQAGIHLALLAGGLASLPIALPAGAVDSLPRDSSPVAWLLLVLTQSVGLPFFALAASAPLFGSWFARATSERGAYALYAASNAGSLIGLLSYPIVVEPRFALQEQTRLWMLGYVALVALAAAAASSVWRSPGSPAAASHEPRPQAAAPTPLRRLRWVGLAFVPSSLMLGATAYLTTDVAAVPLFWVLPLSLYLVSFVLVFAPRPLRPPPWMARGYSLLTICLLVGLLTDSVHSMTIAVPLHLTALLIASIVLHGALAGDRPSAHDLPEYFLWISLGGVLGGMWNTLIAPQTFAGIAEYPLTMMLGCFLRPGPSDDLRDRRSLLLDLVLPAALGTATALAILAVQRVEPIPGRLTTLAIFVPAALLGYSFVTRPLRFSLGLLAILWATTLFTSGHGKLVRTERNFFGIVRLTRDGGGRFLQVVHGNTLHGRQASDPSARCVPSVYYHRDGPLGDLFREIPSPAGAHVAVVGLGAGTNAAYASPGEHWTFYEINPVIAGIAENDFRYLSDCFAGEARTIRLGDARLEIAAAGPGEYHRMVLDAFNSDAIPVHLLTREALALYLSKLAAEGAIALHLSNTFLDLRPVVAAVAADAGLVAYLRDDRKRDRLIGKEYSRWVVLARRPEHLGSIPAHPSWKRLAPAPGLRPWTDAYSDIWSVIDWQAGH